MVVILNVVKNLVHGRLPGANETLRYAQGDRPQFHCLRGRSSVTPERRIDRHRPAIDAAFQVHGIFDAHALQELTRHRAAATVMAHDDELAIGVECFGPFIDLAERQQLRTLDVHQIIFPGFTHIQKHRAAVLRQPSKFTWRDRLSGLHPPIVSSADDCA